MAGNVKEGVPAGSAGSGKGQGVGGGSGAGSGGSAPGEGIRSVRATGLFRAVNFELYAKPNKVVMGFGIVALTSCIAYLAYLNAQKENQKDKEMYEQYREDGTTLMRPKRSKWD